MGACGYRLCEKRAKSFTSTPARALGCTPRAGSGRYYPRAIRPSSASEQVMRRCFRQPGGRWARTAESRTCPTGRRWQGLRGSGVTMASLSAALGRDASRALTLTNRHRGKKHDSPAFEPLPKG